MNKHFFSRGILLLALLGSTPIFSQNTLFVAPGGTGDGSSWKKATNDLQNALKMAQNGDQIWVAEGLYVPTESRNRSIAFEISKDISVLGGFAGTEKQLSERKINLHPTILSGNIGNSDVSEDNSYNVVRMRGARASTILEGFIITNGFADGDIEANISNRSGGGLFNDGSKRASNPMILECVFIDNYAKDGGAVYNFGRGGKANPTFTNCEFTSNRADLDGGAVNNDGRSEGEASPIFNNCRFELNIGNYGGAIFYYSKSDTKLSNFKQCTFAGNAAMARGGAIFMIAVGETKPEWQFEKVVFLKNKAFHEDSANTETMCLR
jgi:hypothetical protein